MNDEEKLRNLYLKKLANGELQGPPVGKIDVDKPWLKYYSDEIILKDDINGTLYTNLLETCQKFPNNIAIEYFGKKITYKKLLDNILLAEQNLKNQGLTIGDKISLVMPTTPETIYLFFAANKLGIIPNMIDPRINPNQILDFINNSDSKVVFTIDLVSPKIEEVKDELNTKNIYSISALNSASNIVKILGNLKKELRSAKKNNKYPTYSSFLVNKKIDYSKKEETLANKDNDAAIVYTTGTTGNPKGAVITNYNILSLYNSTSITMKDINENTRILGIMPPFLAYGVSFGLVIPLIIGTHLKIIPKFDIEKFASYILKFKPNVVIGVPSFFEKLVNDPKMDKEDMNYLTWAICGGGPMTVASEKRINDFFKKHNCPAKIVKGYGMTEVSSAFTIPISDDCNKEGSVGIPLVNNNIKVLNGDGEAVNYFNDEEGEIYLEGPTVIKEYFKNPDETKKTILKLQDMKKWVKTGDIGRIDKDGCLYITNRKKETIIRPDGHNVFPSKIDNQLSTHPNVEAVCTVGLPSLDSENGEIVTTFVVLKSNYIDSLEKIEAELNELALKKLQIRDITMKYYFIPKIPLMADGKVDQKKIKEIGIELQSKENCKSR